MLKNNYLFKKTINFIQGNNTSGLVYGSATIGDLVTKDADVDGVPDWEEPLWGLNPTKKETTPGTLDSVAIEKMKAEQGQNSDFVNGSTKTPENLTQTDKFSRELFSTIAATTQSGSLDQATADQISSSLAEHIQNSPQRKIYLFSDLKITSDESLTMVKKYNDTLNNVYRFYPVTGNVLDILQRFVADEKNVNTDALAELEPMISQLKARINGMLKIEVPQSLSVPYLALLNTGEKIVENLEDITLYESDPIVALSGITQYEQNTSDLEANIGKLVNAINQKLKN